MKYIGYYSPKTPLYMVYMLQQVEYRPMRFLDWLRQVDNLEGVIRRQTLHLTKNATAFLVLSYMIWVLIGLLLIWFLIIGWFVWAFLWLLIAPLTLAIILCILAGSSNVVLDVAVRKNRLLSARKIFATTGTVRLAVLGSYAKTSTKEVLLTVLSAGNRNVVASPGNKNVAYSHALWSRQFKGDEDIIIIEYGEGEPGDIRKLAELSQPTHAVITGIAPNHLDRYKTISALAADFQDVYQFVTSKNVIVNEQARDLLGKVATESPRYGHGNALGWEAKHVQLYVDRTTFTAVSGHRSLELQTHLIGEHNVDTLLLAVAIADLMGLDDEQIKRGVAATKPFEHRMQPYALNGAWVIDDTYNGNIEGMKAGLRLLKSLSATRKMYVTPGLVEQGSQIRAVHTELAKAIVDANPDIVVLMVHKHIGSIKEGLTKFGFKGKLIEEHNPLEFYQGLEHFIVNGDVVLMQNDLPDAYL